MHLLVKWMLETDVNPYSYLPEHWAGAVKSAEGFASLVHMLSHALHDDGDVTFVKVDGVPRIVFAWRHEDNFTSLVLSESEKERFAHYVSSPTIEVLDIEPNQFGVLCDAYQKEWLKDCFTTDALNGIEWAAEHYRSYRQWDESWIALAKAEYGDKVK